MASFIDFYNKYSIIPVSQNIVNQSDFIAKRKHLLLSLGVPAVALDKFSVCEFGPGTGQNAQALLELGVSNLTLVDASTQALKLLHELKAHYSTKVNSFQVIESTFLDYKPDTKFQLVIAEGCIPHQASPTSIAKSISAHVAESGIFLFSTISGLSHLPETLRRLYSSLILNKNHPSISDLDKLVSFFESDFLSLPSRTRKSIDWCLDVLVQPLHQSLLFSQAEAIEALDSTFEVYHTLPSLPSPFYWYKDYDKINHNCKYLESYYKTNMCLISTSAASVIHSSSVGKQAEFHGIQIWDTVAKFQQGNASLSEVTILLRELSKIYKAVYPFVSDYLEASCLVIANFQTMHSSNEYKNLGCFWGRGQQYLSMIKRVGLD